MNQALVIDDNQFNLELMQELLRLEGYNCIPIQDPMDVSSIIDKLNEINVVFVDIKMPNLDGYQVLSILSRHINSNTPIVACSGYVNHMDTARETGFQHFISKPLNMQQFPNQLQRITNGISVWDD